MNLLADLQGFASDHRPHGPLTADATEPAWNGYLLLTVACPCGITFGRWMPSWIWCVRPHGTERLQILAPGAPKLVP